MFSFSIFEILLFEARSVLRPTKRVIRTKGLIWSVLLRYQMPRRYNIADWLSKVSLTWVSNDTSLQHRKLVSFFYVTMRRRKDVLNRSLSFTYQFSMVGDIFTYMTPKLDVAIMSRAGWVVYQRFIFV